MSEKNLKYRVTKKTTGKYLPAFKTNQKPGWSGPELRVYRKERFGVIFLLDKLANGSK